MSNTAYVSYEVSATQAASYPEITTTVSNEGVYPAHTQGYIKTLPFSDNFSRISNYWTTFGSGESNGAQATVTPADNQLQLTILSTSTGGLYAGALTSQPLQLAGGSVSFEFAQPSIAATSGSNVSLGMTVLPSSVSWGTPANFAWTYAVPFGPNPLGLENYALVCNSGLLRVTYGSETGGSDYSATYDPVNNKYGQIAVGFVGGTETVYFSVSPDNINWTEVFSGPRASRFSDSLENAYVLFFAYSPDVLSSPTTFALANYEYSGAGGNPLQAVASASVVILSPSNEFVAATGPGLGLPDTITAVINQGDTPEAVRNSLVGAVREAANDPSLYVEFRG